jgi:hypothetical protein
MPSRIGFLVLSVMTSVTIFFAILLQRSFPGFWNKVPAPLATLGSIIAGFFLTAITTLLMVSVASLFIRTKDSEDDIAQFPEGNSRTSPLWGHLGCDEASKDPEQAKLIENLKADLKGTRHSKRKSP